MDGKIDLSELNKNLKKINELRYNNNELSDTNKIVELPVTVELNGFYYKIKNDGTVIYSNQLETENIYSEEVKTLLNYGISIEFDDGILFIEAEIKTKDDQKYLVRERRNRSLRRTFSLGDIDEDSIKAKYENGLLSVSVNFKQEIKKDKKTIIVE